MIFVDMPIRKFDSAEGYNDQQNIEQYMLLKAKAVERPATRAKGLLTEPVGAYQINCEYGDHPQGDI